MNLRYFLLVLMAWAYFLPGTGVWGQDCDCEPLAPATAYDSVDYIFAGTCIQVNSNWISGGMKYSFEVDSCWKKPSDRFFIVNTPFAKNCGVAFEVGRDYLVYVRRVFTPKTNRCLGSKPLSVARADLEFLGESVAPRPSRLVQPMYWLLGGLGLFALLAVAFVVLGNRKGRGNPPS